MNCNHQRKISWGESVACLDCKAILPAPEQAAVAPELSKETFVQAIAAQTITDSGVRLSTDQARLNDNGRKVLELRRQMLTHQAIAEIMGKSVATIRALETTAIKAIKRGAI